MIRALISLTALVLLVAAAYLVYQRMDRPPGREMVAEAGPAPSAPIAGEPLPEAPPVPQGPPPAPAPAPVTPTPPAAPPAIHTYKVRPGDTLWVISRHYYGTANHVERLAEANGLKSAHQLKVGQVLIIPEIKGKEFAAPPDADHEIVEVPKAPERAAESVPMPPTLNRPVSK